MGTERNLLPGGSFGDPLASFQNIAINQGLLIPGSAADELDSEFDYITTLAAQGVPNPDQFYYYEIDVVYRYSFG